MAATETGRSGACVMDAVVAVVIGTLILAALAYDIGRLITPEEPRRPPLTRLRGRRASLEAAERWCVGLRVNDRIGPDAYRRRMSALARGERTARRGGQSSGSRTKGT
jgi:hypothetical protein